MKRYLGATAVAFVSLFAAAAGEPFRRGDINNDGAVDISDFIYNLAFLFRGGPPPHCLDAADVNDDGNVDISDSVYGLTFLFAGGPPPPPPGPATPGFDPTANDPYICGDGEESPAEELTDLGTAIGGFDASPDGLLGIAVAPGDGIGKIVDLARGRLLGEFKTGINPGTPRFTRTGRSALIVNRGTNRTPGTDVTWVSLRDSTRPEERRIELRFRAYDLVPSPADSMVLALGAGTDEKPAEFLGILDGDQGELLRVLSVGFRPRCAAFDANGRVAVIAGERAHPELDGGQLAGAAVLLDVGRRAIVRSGTIDPAPLPVCIRFLGNEAFVTDGTQTGPAVVKLNSDLKPTGAVGRGRQGELLLLSNGARGYALSQAGNELLIFDPRNMRAVRTIHLEEPESDPVQMPVAPLRRMVLSDDEGLLLVTAHGEHLAALATRTDRLLGQVKIDARNLGFTLSEIALREDKLFLPYSDGFLGVVSVDPRLEWRLIDLPDWLPFDPPAITRIPIAGDTCIDDVAILVDDGENSEDTSFVDATNQELMENVVPRFYETFPDVFDFLVVFYASDFGDVTSPGAFAWSWTCRNYTRGIGFSLGNGINGTGTIVTDAGTNRLQCFIWENDLNEYDGDLNCQNRAANAFGDLRSGLSILGQEVFHRWGTRLDVTGKGCAMLRDSWHYSQWFNSDASVIGGNQGYRIRDDGGGNFTRTAVETTISQYDQYLAGLRLPEDVTMEMFCVQNPTALVNNSFRGTRRNITMNDIIQENGGRIPSAALSQRNFNVAYALVVPENQVLLADLERVKRFRDEFTAMFELQTAGFLNTRVCGPFLQVAGTISSGLGSSPGSVDISPNGSWAYVTALQSNTVTVIDADPLSPTFLQRLGTIPVGSRPTDVAFHPNSSRAYVSLLDANRLDVINTSSRTVAGSIPTGTAPISVYVNRAPFGFVANRDSDDVTVFRPNMADAIGEFDVGDRPEGVTGSFDNEVVVVTNRSDNTVTVRGTRTGRVVTAGVGALPVGIDLVQYESLPNQTVERANASRSPVSLAYVCNAGADSISAIDITTNPDDPADFTADVVATIPLEGSPIAVAFQPGGAIALAVSRMTGVVSVIATATHSVIGTVDLAPGIVDVAFSPDGEFAWIVNEVTGTLTVLE